MSSSGLYPSIEGGTTDDADISNDVKSSLFLTWCHP